jgi:hypothetical protein
MSNRRPGLSAGPGSRTARAALALAGLLLAVAGCGRVLPLGLSAVPVPGHLAAAITLQPGVPAPAQGAPSAASCPAGSAPLPAADLAPFSTVCFQRLGPPVTFTSAAATVYRQPAGPQGQPAHYVLRITLTPAGAAALSAVTTQVAGTKDALAITVVGQAWAIVGMSQPVTNGEFGIPLESLSQALQLQRILLQPA